jgi:hypothetical protein
MEARGCEDEGRRAREPRSTNRCKTSLDNPLLCILLFALGSASPALASSFSISSSATVTDPAGGSCQQTGTTSASCSGGGTFVYGDGQTTTFGGSAYGAADYGVLHAAASGGASCTSNSVTNCYSPSAGTAEGEASFFDTLNITGGPVDGYLDFSLVADGTGAVTCVILGSPLDCGAAQTILSLANFTGAPTINGVTGNFILGVGTTDATILVPFGASQLIGGGVTQVEVEMFLDSYVNCAVADGDTCSAFTDFSNTAIVTGLRVLDADFNPVPSAVVTTASGTNYNDIQSTPEPPTLFLLGVPLLTLGLARRLGIGTRTAVRRFNPLLKFKHFDLS